MTNNNTANNPPLDDYRWLVGPSGQAWLRRVEEDRRDTLAIVQSLRRDLSADRAHLLLEQVELRRRAGDKFADAGRMFFTRTGLEQSTDQVVAAYKARRYEAYDGRVDLCCGVGGDLMALARENAAATVLGVDRDRVVALLAATNVRDISPNARTVVADAADFPVPAGYAWHLDPDRRPLGRRTTQLEWHSPDLAAVERLIGRCPNGSIKLAPAANVPDEWVARVELEWISRRRQCRQLVAWMDNLARSPGQRRATRLHADTLDAQPTARSLVGRPAVSIPTAADVGRFVFEPDPAVLAADLTGELAVRHDLKRLAPQSVYLTSDHPLAKPLATCFEVDDVLPFDRKRLKRHLAQHGIARLEIKQRGMAVDPERLRKELQVAGARTADQGDTVLILARRDDGVVAILCKRVKES